MSKEIDQNGEECVREFRAAVKENVGNLNSSAEKGVQLVLLIRLRRFLQEIYNLSDKYVDT